MRPWETAPTRGVVAYGRVAHPWWAISAYLTERGLWAQTLPGPGAAQGCPGLESGPSQPGSGRIEVLKRPAVLTGVTAQIPLYVAESGLQDVDTVVEAAQLVRRHQGLPGVEPHPRCQPASLEGPLPMTLPAELAGTPQAALSHPPAAPLTPGLFRHCDISIGNEGCGDYVPPFVATIELTKENFEQTIVENDTVIVDFWAEWCGPCRGFAPTFESASEANDDIVFGKVDTEAQPELAQYFNIMSIPTLMVFRDNVVLYSQAGALPPEMLDSLIEQVRVVDMEEVHRKIAEHEAAEHEHASEAQAE
jgi:thioredoxin 1